MCFAAIASGHVARLVSLLLAVMAVRAPPLMTECAQSSTDSSQYTHPLPNHVCLFAVHDGCRRGHAAQRPASQLSVVKLCAPAAALRLRAFFLQSS